MFDHQLPIAELQYVDETNSKGALQVKMPLGISVEDGDANATALASLIAPITSCTLVRQRIIYKAFSPTREAASPASSVTFTGVFIFTNATEDKYAIIAVPGILYSKLIPNDIGQRVLIDTEDDDIAAFIALIISLGMTNVFGDVCDTLVAAYRQSRV